MRLKFPGFHNFVSRIIFSICLVISFFLTSSTVLAEVCYDSTSTFNSSGYTLNTPLQTTPGLPLSFFNGSIRLSSVTFTGTARWVNGAQVQNVSPFGDYLYLQPDRATDYLNTNNDVTYVFTFPKRTTSFTTIFAGLNVYDGTTISASYLGSPVAITAANFSDLSSGMTLKDADGNGQSDTVVSSNSAGGTAIDTNTYKLTISSPIDTLTVNSGKDQSGNTSTVTIGIRTFNYCVISPNLSVTKSSNGPWSIGQSGAQYTLNVTNTGEEATSGTITVTDVLPTGITPNWTGTRTVDGFACTYSGQNVTCARTTALASAGTAAITLPVNVTNSTPVGTNSITNYASIGGGGDPFNSGSAPTPGATCTNAAHCASNQTTVNTPNLTIAKADTGNFTIGSAGTYQITVGNSGTAATSGTITVSDTLPTGLTVANGALTLGGTNSANWSCSAASNVITCTSSTAIATSGSSVFTFNVNVGTGTAVGTNSISNTATVSGGNEATANNGNNSSTDLTTVLSPNLTIAKSHTPTTFIRGSIGAYNLTIGNSGTSATTGTITVTDTLPTGLSIADGAVTLSGTNAANWSCTAASNVITCTSSTAIATSGSSVFSFSVNVASNAAASVTNNASVSGGGEATANNGNNSTTDATPTIAPSDLTLAKSHSGSFTVGSTGTYSFTVTNGGGSATSGAITVSDTLPTGLTVNNGTAGSVTPGGTNAANWSCSSNAASPQVITCTSSTAIAVSGTSVFNFNVNVGLGTAVGTNSVTNNASVSGGGQINTANDSATDPTTIISPNLTIAKSHTGNFTRGSTGTYTLTIGNSGTAATSGTITVTDTLPTGLSVSNGALTLGGTNSANWSCSAASNVITCTSSTAIATSGSSVFTFSVNVASNAAASVTNNASVSGGNEATANNGNNSTTDPTTTVAPPDLTLAKSHTGSFTVGSAGTYSLTVTNSGGLASSGTITVSDTLPSGLTVNSGTAGSVTVGGTNAANWSCNSNAASPQVITCTSSTAIASSVTSVFNFAVNVGLGTAVGTNSVTNSASVSGGGESDSSNNSATDPTTVISPNLTITKSHTGSFTVGSTGNYSLTIGNSGTASTNGTITVTDTLPTGLTVNGGAVGSVTPGGTNAANWTCNSNAASPQVITCTSSTAIAASGTSVFNFNVNVGLGTALGTNSITNSASVSGGREATANNTDNSTTDPTTVLSPDLTVAKSHTGNFTRGSTGTYTLTVGNSGTASTSGTITLTDTLPTGLSIADGAVTLSGTNAANWSCTAASNVITCTSSTAIATSGSSVFSFTVNVASNAAASVTNTVSVSGGNEATINNGNNSGSDPTTINSNPPNVTLVKSCPSPANCTTAPQLPGTDVTYKIDFANIGGSGANNLVIVDGIPNYTDYKISSASTTVGTTGLTFTIEFSSDYDALNPTLASWTYTPVSGGGGANTGYDRNVKAVRWRVTSGTLSSVSPNNAGYLAFVTKIRQKAK